MLNIIQMPMLKDFYSVLDIAPSTSKEEIRQAYLRLARQYHPDTSRVPNAREQFEAVHEAYVVLSDEKARECYNLYREEALEKAEREELEDYAPPLMPLLWWHELAVVVIVAIVILGVLGILALCGLVLYTPFL